MKIISLGEKVRREAFWIKDYLFGSYVRNNYDDIDYILSRNDNFEERKSRYLDNILKHAISTTAFYRDISFSLDAFPVIDKSTIIDNYNQMISQSIWKEKTTIRMTSGSTGTPLKVMQDTRKRKRVHAELKYFGDKCGYLSHEKMAYLKVWNTGKKNVITSYLQNIFCYEISNLDNNSIGFILDDMKEKGIKVILSYASTLDAIARFVDQENHINLSVHSIIGISESLSEPTRISLSKAFKHAKIVSRYSNNENGILAQDTGANTDFLINDASYFIEILDINSDKRFPFGEIGRIVVTDLFNYALPIIRYDTGDIGSMVENDRGQVFLNQLFGRKVDTLFNTSGKMISPHAITNIMWGKFWIKQYQLIQKSKTDYLLILNVEANVKTENLDSQLRQILGYDANIMYESVDVIPVLSSGKRRSIISEL